MKHHKRDQFTTSARARLVASDIPNKLKKLHQRVGALRRREEFRFVFEPGNVRLVGPELVWSNITTLPTFGVTAVCMLLIPAFCFTTLHVPSDAASTPDSPDCNVANTRVTKTRELHLESMAPPVFQMDAMQRCTTVIEILRCYFTLTALNPVLPCR